MYVTLMNYRMKTKFVLIGAWYFVLENHVNFKRAYTDSFQKKMLSSFKRAYTDGFQKKILSNLTSVLISH